MGCMILTAVLTVAAKELTALLVKVAWRGMASRARRKQQIALTSNEQ